MEKPLECIVGGRYAGNDGQKIAGNVAEGDHCLLRVY